MRKLILTFILTSCILNIDSIYGAEFECDFDNFGISDNCNVTLTKLRNPGNRESWEVGVVESLTAESNQIYDYSKTNNSKETGRFLAVKTPKTSDGVTNFYANIKTEFIALTKGSEYEISFQLIMYSNDPDYEKANDKVDVSIIGPDTKMHSIQFNSNNTNHTSYSWQKVSFTFTATESLGKIVIIVKRENKIGTNSYIGIDELKLTESPNQNGSVTTEELTTTTEEPATATTEELTTTTKEPTTTTEEPTSTTEEPTTEEPTTEESTKTTEESTTTTEKSTTTTTEEPTTTTAQENVEYTVIPIPENGSISQINAKSYMFLVVSMVVVLSKYF